MAARHPSAVPTNTLSPLAPDHATHAIAAPPASSIKDTHPKFLNPCNLHTPAAQVMDEPDHALTTITHP